MSRDKGGEEGSILLSTFHLLLFLTFLILALTTVVQNQVMQLRQISHSYEARALIALSEDKLREKLESQEVESGTIAYSTGNVEIIREAEKTYLLVATLNNSYTSKSKVEIIRETTVDDPTDQETSPDAESETWVEEGVEYPGLTSDFLESEQLQPVAEP